MHAKEVILTKSRNTSDATSRPAPHEIRPDGAYAAGRRNVLARFAAHIDGSPSGLVVVASASALGGDAQGALQKSFEALGYGPAPCTFVTIQPRACAQNDEQAAACRNAAGRAQPRSGEARERPSRSTARALDETTLFAVVEGLDPQSLVLADLPACQLAASTYHAPVKAGQPTRLLCRTVAAFSSFEAMLDTPEDKQRAWALLKQLPRFGEIGLPPTGKSSPRS